MATLSREKKNSAVLDRRILFHGREVLGVFRQQKMAITMWLFKERVIIVYAKQKDPAFPVPVKIFSSFSYLIC